MMSTAISTVLRLSFFFMSAYRRLPGQSVNSAVYAIKGKEIFALNVRNLCVYVRVCVSVLGLFAGDREQDACRREDQHAADGEHTGAVTAGVRRLDGRVGNVAGDDGISLPLTEAVFLSTAPSAASALTVAV